MKSTETRKAKRKGRKFKRKGRLTWRDSLKIGFGIAIAPYIFAVITTILWLVYTVTVLTLSDFSPDFMESLQRLWETLQRGEK